MRLMASFLAVAAVLAGAAAAPLPDPHLCGGAEVNACRMTPSALHHASRAVEKRGERLTCGRNDKGCFEKYLQPDPLPKRSDLPSEGLEKRDDPAVLEPCKHKQHCSQANTHGPAVKRSEQETAAPENRCQKGQHCHRPDSGLPTRQDIHAGESLPVEGLNKRSEASSDAFDKREQSAALEPCHGKKHCAEAAGIEPVVKRSEAGANQHEPTRLEQRCGKHKKGGHHGLDEPCAPEALEKREEPAILEPCHGKKHCANAEAALNKRSGLEDGKRLPDRAEDKGAESSLHAIALSNAESSDLPRKDADAPKQDERPKQEYNVGTDKARPVDSAAHISGPQPIARRQEPPHRASDEPKDWTSDFDDRLRSGLNHDAAV